MILFKRSVASVQKNSWHHKATSKETLWAGNENLCFFIFSNGSGSLKAQTMLISQRVSSIYKSIPRGCLVEALALLCVCTRIPIVLSCIFHLVRPPIRAPILNPPLSSFLHSPFFSSLYLLSPFSPDILERKLLSYKTLFLPALIKNFSAEEKKDYVPRLTSHRFLQNRCDR